MIPSLDGSLSCRAHCCFRLSPQRENPTGLPKAKSLGTSEPGSPRRRSRAGAEAVGVIPAEEEGKASVDFQQQLYRECKGGEPMAGSVKETTLDF